MDSRVKLFINKTAENDLERIIKAFLKDYDVMGTPFYNLDDKGNAWGGLFISTDHEKDIIENVIITVAPDADFELKDGPYYMAKHIYPGYWVKFAA